MYLISGKRLERLAIRTFSRAESYNYAVQLGVGEEWEDEIDKFVRDFLLEESLPVSRQLQQIGIDRIWERWDGTRVSVEYKADIKAAQTGNVFIETISVDTAGKAGWAHTSLAQQLVIYIPGHRRVLIVQMLDMKARLVDWTEQFKTRPAQNNGYQTHGLLIPIDVFARECQAEEYDWPLSEMRVEP